MHAPDIHRIPSQLGNRASTSRKAVVSLFRESLMAWVVLIAVGMTLLLAVFGSIMFDYSSAITWLASLVLAVLCAVGIGWYLSALDRQFGVRQVKYDWQLEVTPRVSNVSAKTWSRFRWMLLAENPTTGRPREDVVLRATRRHVIVLIKDVMPAVMLWLLALFVVVVLPWLIDSIIAAVDRAASYTRQPGQTVPDLGVSRHSYRAYVPWWIMLVVTPVALLLGWLLSFDWRYKIFAITNLGQRVMKVPPIWMPWLDVQNSNFLFNLLKLANPKPPGFLGNMLGYGTVKTGTYLDNSEDEEIREMDYLPDYHDFADNLEAQLTHGHARDPMA